MYDAVQKPGHTVPIWTTTVGHANDPTAANSRHRDAHDVSADGIIDLAADDSPW
jgi:hypothetical protein